MALRSVARRDPTRAAIVSLGEEAAALLRAIPDGTALRRADRAFAAGGLNGPLVHRMARLIERYRRDCDIDRLAMLLRLAEAHACHVAPNQPAFPLQEQVGLAAQGKE